MKRPGIGKAATLAVVIGMASPWALAAQGEPPTLSSQESTLVGCYELTIGEWTDDGQVFWRPQATLPDTIRLHPQRSDDGRGFRLTPFIARLPYSSWRLFQSGDSVSLSWGTRMSGEALRLEVRGDTLQGTARPFIDAVAPGAPRPVATALAVRVFCRGDGTLSRSPPALTPHRQRRVADPVGPGT